MIIIRLSTFLDFGGIETKMTNLSAINDVKNEWIFVAIGKGGEAEKNIKNNGKQVYCLQKSHKIPSFIAICALISMFKKIKPDVVHCSGAEANFHGVIAAKLVGVPVVVSEEIGIPKHGIIAKFFFKLIFKLSNYVLGESELVVNNLVETYNLDLKKTLVVPNFINIEQKVFPRKFETKPYLKIISVSRLEFVKNISGIINVVAQLRQKGYSILYDIIGYGSLENELKNQIQSLNLSEFIKLKGYQKDPKPYLIEADLYVLNSYSEGFSNSLLEAMLLETPSISTNVGAAKECIDDNENGWIINSNCETQLFEAIENFIKLNSQERKQIGQKAKEKIIANYTMKSHLNILQRIYTKL